MLDIILCQHFRAHYLSAATVFLYTFLFYIIMVIRLAGVLAAAEFSINAANDFALISFFAGRTHQRLRLTYRCGT